MHRLDLGLYSHPKEFWGNGVRSHVNSKGKIPSTGRILLRGGWSPRRCIKQDSEPSTLPTIYSAPRKMGRTGRYIYVDHTIPTRSATNRKYMPPIETTQKKAPIKAYLYATQNYHVLAIHRLVGLVVKVSASRAEDPGFESRRDFSGVESYQ